MGYYRQVGDPFFGAALPLLGGLARKVIPTLVKKAPAVIGRAGAAIGRVGRKAAPIAAAGAVFEGGARVGRRLAGGGEERRYRRMNVANVKALRRAIRRANGFSKLARSVLTFTSPKAPRGKAIFRKKRR